MTIHKIDRKEIAEVESKIADLYEESGVDALQIISSLLYMTAAASLASGNETLTIYTMDNKITLLIEEITKDAIN